MTEQENERMTILEKDFKTGLPVMEPNKVCAMI